MKSFSKNGAKFAAAVAMSVMALGYTTSVWADESAVVTETGKQYENKGTLTERLTNIYFSSEKADNVKGIGLDIYKVEKLNIVNSEEGGLFIGGRAIATKNAVGIGINVKDAQANFDIKDAFFVQASGVIREPEANEQSQGVGREPEANVSMKAVGFYGENGSSQIKADSVNYMVRNEDHREAPTGTLDEVTLGMDLNKFAINMLAKENIEIYSMIAKENMLPGKKTVQGMVLNSSKASLQTERDIRILAAVSYGERLTREIPASSFGSVSGIYADSSELAMQADGRIQIGAGIQGFTGNNELAAINASNSKLDIKAERGIEIIALNKDREGNSQYNNVYAIVADNSEIALDGGSSVIAINGNVNVSNKSVLKLSRKREIGDIGIYIRGNVNVANNSEVALDGSSSEIYILGNVNVSNNSVLKLSGKTSIVSGITRATTSDSSLNVDDSTLIVDGFMQVSGSTVLNKAKIYLYDANNAEDAFHTLSINDLKIDGSNELFLRADSSMEVNNSPLNSDVIDISGNIITDNMTEEDKLYVNVFDKGMKNGYGMGTDDTKTLYKPITVLYNSNDSNASNFSSLITSLINSKKVNVNDVHYDNGIWSYTYDDMSAEQDGNGNVVINKVNVTAAPSASGSQRSLHSANKAAGALAIGVLGNDNALHAHLREAQGAGEREREEVWAQYLGGKLKSDGMQLKHNGVELGYDAYVGSNWTFGVSGMQTRGNTQLDSGSGKAKTNVGTVYGAWHGGSTYLNLEAKAGRVSSESKTFGGTVLQKIAGEFSAPAYSVSAEYGSTHELPAAWYLEPAVRLSYVHLGAADYGVQVKDTLARVANDSLDSFILRGGAKLGRRLGAKGSFYVKAAAVYDFDGDLATTVSADGRTAHYEDSLGGWGVEYGAGLEYKLGKAANISLDVERRSGGELKRDWGVNIGVNYSF